MSELALLVCLGVAAWFWLESRHVQEITVAHCRRACENAGVQFLDDIAPVWGTKLARDANGVMRLRRVYTFDYSDACGERRSGSIVMLGRTPVAVHFEGQTPTDSDPSRQSSH
jgi:hypothetical protein